MKSEKSVVKRIHLVIDDGLYDRKAFYTVKIAFFSSSFYLAIKNLFLGYAIFQVPLKGSQLE